MFLLTERGFMLCVRFAGYADALFILKISA